MADSSFQSQYQSSMARTYNERTGGCNIQLANHLIALITPFLPTPSSSTLRLLDSACGPLILSTQCMNNDHLTQLYPAVHISAIDLSEDFIKASQALIDATPEWNSNGRKIHTAVMNGMDLGFQNNVFDVAFNSLAIFAYPDPVKGVRELHRVLKPGGVAAFTTWKRVGWQSILHEVERLVRPGQELTQFPFLDAWYAPGKLEQTMIDGGLKDVKESDVLTYAWFESEEKAAECLTETLKLLVGSNWSVGEKENMREGFERVLRDGKAHVIKRDGGKVGFEMVAWTGVGKK